MNKKIQRTAVTAVAEAFGLASDSSSRPAQKGADTAWPFVQQVGKLLRPHASDESSVQAKKKQKKRKTKSADNDDDMKKKRKHPKKSGKEKKILTVPRAVQVHLLHHS